VPRHDAAGLDREFAETELALLDVCRLSLEIDGSKHGIVNRYAMTIADKRITRS
jgi:hypothetical protein